MLKSIIRQGAILILAFILCVSLFFLVMCLSVKFTWLNKNFAISILDATGYYNTIYEVILNDYENIGIPSGIPVEVFAKALNPVSVRSDIETGVGYLYDENKKSPINTETLKQELNNAFVAYAEEIGADIDDNDVREALDLLVDYCTKQYISIISFPYANLISPYIPTILKMVNFALIGCLVIIIICICILSGMIKLKSMCFIGASMTGGGLLCIIPCMVAMSETPYKRLNLDSEAFYKFITNFIESGFTPVIIIGIIMLVVGVCMSVFGIIIDEHYNRKKNKYIDEPSVRQMKTP